MKDENTPQNPTEQEGVKDNSTSETNPSPVEEVNKNYEELKSANDKVESELLRKEQLKAKIAIGGETSAGQEPIKKTDDEKWAEGAKERYEGTGLDPTSDDTPTTYS